MARILVHAVAAMAGGGLTYLRNVLRLLPKHGAEHEWIVLPSPALAKLPLTNLPNVQWLDPQKSASGIKRVLFDQLHLGRLLKNHDIDLLLATGNFGMVRPPVPQVLLNRNALYFSREHIRQLRRRGDYRQLLETVVRRKIAVASIQASAVNITPTQAFADQIAGWLRHRSAARFQTIPFGFDHDGFSRGVTPEVQASLARRLNPQPGVRRILLVSSFNYFRNFETLIKAVAILKDRHSQPIELILTTRVERGHREHRYDTSHTARLIEELGLTADVTMLGSVPHTELPALYEFSDVVVCPSYAESFGHPMVEAMACCRPLVVSDQGVHREICRGAAMYFSTFDEEELAFRISQILDDPRLAGLLASRGRERASDFSWPEHVDRLVRAIDSALRQEVSHAHAA